MLRNPLFLQDAALQRLSQCIETYRPAVYHQGDLDRSLGVLIASGPRTGYLKQDGLKPTFGFLRDETGVDTHVLRDNVGEDLWAAMCQGAVVRYEIQQDKFGRTTARSVQPA